jgi:hypothetical protein
MIPCCLATFALRYPHRRKCLALLTVSGRRQRDGCALARHTVTPCANEAVLSRSRIYTSRQPAQRCCFECLALPPCFSIIRSLVAQVNSSLNTRAPHHCFRTFRRFYQATSIPGNSAINSKQKVQGADGVTLDSVSGMLHGPMG